MTSLSKNHVLFALSPEHIYDYIEEIQNLEERYNEFLVALDSVEFATDIVELQEEIEQIAEGGHIPTMLFCHREELSSGEPKYWKYSQDLTHFLACIVKNAEDVAKKQDDEVFAQYQHAIGELMYAIADFLHEKKDSYVYLEAEAWIHVQMHVLPQIMKEPPDLSGFDPTP